MDLFTFIFWVVIISAVAKIVSSAIETDRATRIAKVEADLKLKLAERVRDPELIRMIVDAKLPKDGDVDKRLEEALTNQPPPAPVPVQPTNPKPSKVASLFVLVGLICFLLGLAFGVVSWIEGDTGFLIPALVNAAVGLAFLTWATSQKQILQATGVVHGTTTDGPPAEGRRADAPVG